VGDAKNIACTDASDWLIMITKRCPINLAYKSPFAISPPLERALVSHGPHGGVLYASLYGSGSMLSTHTIPNICHLAVSTNLSAPYSAVTAAVCRPRPRVTEYETNAAAMMLKAFGGHQYCPDFACSLRGALLFLPVRRK
jgi:hypothetical protein